MHNTSTIYIHNIKCKMRYKKINKIVYITTQKYGEQHVHIGSRDDPV